MLHNKLENPKTFDNRFMKYSHKTKIEWKYLEFFMSFFYILMNLGCARSTYVKFHYQISLEFFFLMINIQACYDTLQKFEVWDQKKCLDMWHSSINPNLYVDYGNMIHFAVTAPASEGWLNVGRIHHQIGQNGLSGFSDISKV